MKVIFLDIDGVLNSDKYMHELIYKDIKEYENNIYQFIDEMSVDIIVQLCEVYNIKLVITSSWRHYDLKSTLEFFNKEENKKLHPLIPYIIDITPRLYKQDENSKIIDYLKRGEEIQEWLNNTSLNVDNYVILDDDTDILESQKNHFVHIDNKHGLNGKFRYVAQIKKILNI